MVTKKQKIPYTQTKNSLCIDCHIATQKNYQTVGFADGERVGPVVGVFDGEEVTGFTEGRLDVGCVDGAMVTGLAVGVLLDGVAEGGPVGLLVVGVIDGKLVGV